MTREEFALIAAGLKAVYADITFIADGAAMDVWYSLLCDLPYDLASMAATKYMATQKFPPKPADIREMAASITEPESNQMSELEAWQVVYKAICNSGYNSEEEFKKLPEICQKAVGSPSMLREWALMDVDTVQSVEQSHFIRNYRAMLERSRADAKITPMLKEKIKDYRITQTHELAERMLELKGGSNGELAN